MKNKVLVLGVDGLDPRLTKKYMEKGVCLILQNLRNVVRQEKIW